MRKLKVLEAFSGYGSQSISLQNIGIPYEVVAISEIDKAAIIAYDATHQKEYISEGLSEQEMLDYLLDLNIGYDFKKKKCMIQKKEISKLYHICKKHNNLGDISKIKAEELPKHDLFTYSFPCQDISVAGKTEGIKKGQTRSGLLYECEKIIEHCRPKYLLMKNVKNLVGKKFKTQFDEWLEYLEGLGYTNYWKVLNAKDYGVPQNRERVFVVSILNDTLGYEFPKPIKLDKCIKDILEDQVDDKYYLSEEVQKRFKITNQNKNIIGTTKPEFRTIGQRDLVYSKDGVMGTLVATDYKQPKQIAEINRVGMLDTKGNEQIRRVYGTNDVSPTLDTMQGGNTQPKILEYKIIQDVKVRKYPVDIAKLKVVLKEHKTKTGLSINDIANKLNVAKTKVEHWFRQDSCFSIPDENVWHDLKNILGITTNEFDESIMTFEIKPNNYDISNRIYDERGISPTLTCCSENSAKKILEYNNKQVELPCVCASRGRNPKNPSSRISGEPTEQRIEVNTNGVSNTITTVQKDNYVICEQRSDEGLRFFKDNICGTLRTINVCGDKRVIEPSYKIRKLTPRECFRLMGLSNYYIDLIQATGLSNSAQYKLAFGTIQTSWK